MKPLFAIALIAAVAVASGCRNSSKTASDPKKAAVVGAAAQPAAKIVYVNTKPNFKFVVLEFSTTEIPSPGSQLTVYRGKERVGTVKLTEPMRPPHITADIIDGNPQRGDEVR